MPKGGDSDADKNVLSPDELDIEAREEVASIGDDRYVIGFEGSPDVPDSADDSAATESTTDGDDDSADEADRETGGDADDGPSSSRSNRHSRKRRITGRDVKRWLGEELAGHDSAYAYHIAAKSRGAVNHQQLATDDIDTAFDGLLVWYARQVANGTPVDEALGILLAESSVKVRYPTERLVAYLDAHDLDPDDSIQDLVEAVDDEDGLVFPRRE